MVDGTNECFTLLCGHHSSRDHWRQTAIVLSWCSNDKLNIDKWTYNACWRANHRVICLGYPPALLIAVKAETGFGGPTSDDESSTVPSCQARFEIPLAGTNGILLTITHT